MSGRDRPGITLLSFFSRSRLAPLPATVLFVWLAFLVLSPLTYNQVRVFEPRAVSDPLFFLPGALGTQMLVGVVALAYLAHLAFHRRLPAGTALDWALVAVLAAYALAISLAIYPRFSLEASFLLGAVVLTFMVFHDLDELSPAALVFGLAFIGLAGAVYALYRVGSDYSDWLGLVSAVDGHVSAGDLIPPSVPRVHDVGDHVNMIALAFNLTLPFALVTALQAPNRAGRAVAGLGAALIVLALFFTVSRAAWVSAAIALPVFLALYRMRETGRPSLRLPSVSRVVILAALAIALIVGLAGVAVVASRWDSRPEWLFRSSLSPRYDAFKVAIEIIRDRPWTGSGPNSFSLLYNVYSGDYPIEDFHPHNGYLAVGVDAGVAGVLAVAALGLVLLFSLWKTYTVSTPERRAWAAACFAAIVALGVHSVADMPNQSKTALLLVAVVGALAMKLAGRPAATSTRTRYSSCLPRLLLLAFVPVFMAGWLWTDLGHSRYNQSLEALAKGDFDSATGKALDATGKDPDFAAYQFHAGVMQAIDYLVRQEKGQVDPSLLDGAILSLRHGLQSEPRSGLGHANLALALQMRGDAEAAVSEARLAMLRSPGDGTIAALAGTVFEWAQVFDEATLAYSEAVTHDAGLIASPFWDGTPFRRDSRSRIVGGTFLSSCQKARVIALYGTRPEDLAPLASLCFDDVSGGADARSRSDLAVALAAQGDERAAVEARSAVDQAPDNPYARTALGLVAARDGDIEAARHEFMLGAHLGDPDAALLLYYTYNEPPALLAANLGLPFHHEATPEEVIKQLQAALPESASFVYDGGIQNYLLGILYYRPRFFRESPLSILIPGDWLNLVSPRTALIQVALKESGSNDDTAGSR